MRKLLYILPVILILGFAACENYVDITPTGKKTVDSTDTYYELIALPNKNNALHTGPTIRQLLPC